MTYAPSTFHANTGEDFFRKNSLLVDGMEPLVTGTYTVPAFDDSDGTSLTITDSCALSGVASAASWAGWNLAASKTKLLAITNQHHSGAGAHPLGYLGIGFHTSTLPATTLVDAYVSVMDKAYGAAHELVTYRSGSLTTLEIVTKLYQDDAAKGRVWGIGLYVDADSNIQKTFVRPEGGSWFEVHSHTADSSPHTSFQSVFLQHSGSNARFITPIMVWGS